FGGFRPCSAAAFSQTAGWVHHLCRYRAKCAQRAAEQRLVTDEIFYQRTLAAGGASARVLGNLAQIYSSKGQYAKAEAVFRQVLKMSPDYPIARNNLAEALARQGKQQQAEEILAATSKETEQT